MSVCAHTDQACVCIENMRSNERARHEIEYDIRNEEVKDTYHRPNPSCSNLLILAARHCRADEG